MAGSSTQIFIGSSKAAKSIVADLSEQLEEMGYVINPWLDSFDTSQHYDESFLKQLGNNEFFVLLLTPDAESKRINNAGSKKARSDVSKLIANQNVIFEAGAAYGRYGLPRTILVQDPSVDLISELQGVKTIKLNSGKITNTSIVRVANQIHNHISKVKSERYDSRIRWLSLFKCRPAAQRKVVDWLKDLESDVAAGWDIQFERCGIIWGPPDNFLLYSAPTLEHFIGFVTDVRNELREVVKQVDSRLIFPNKYWNQADSSPRKMRLNQLVLLTCAPDFVEKTYGALVKAAQDEKRRGIKVDIVTVGITTGDTDVFFITASETERLHQQFIEEHLHARILKDGWLVDNTTSLPISYT